MCGFSGRAWSVSTSCCGSSRTWIPIEGWLPVHHGQCDHLRTSGSSVTGPVAFFKLGSWLQASKKGQFVEAYIAERLGNHRKASRVTAPATRNSESLTRSTPETTPETTPEPSPGALEPSPVAPRAPGLCPGALGPRGRRLQGLYREAREA